MAKIPLSVPIGALCVVVMLLMSVLVGFHFKLNAFNQTTYEQVKKTYAAFEQHPFCRQSLWENLKASIFVPKPRKPCFRPLDPAYDRNGDRISQFVGPVHKTPQRVLPDSF